MRGRPLYFPPGWTYHVNPEGSPFYVNSARHIVTDDPIQRPEICSKIMSWEQRLISMVKAEDLRLPEEYEIYLTVSPDSDKCKYYYVDHSNQTTFWLEEIDPERHDVQLSPVCSVAHMSMSCHSAHYDNGRRARHLGGLLDDNRLVNWLFLSARLLPCSGTVSELPGVRQSAGNDVSAVCSMNAAHHRTRIRPTGAILGPL